MKASAKHVFAVATVIASIGVSSCSDGTLDSTVVLDHEVRPAQPWVATGDLVDSGDLCPSGDRQRVRHWNPDGSPMTDEEFTQLIDAVEADGLDLWHVRRITEREHVCDDGSGAFTVREDATGLLDRATTEIIGGTGAYTDMTGTCVIELTEDENRQVVEMVTTCEFDTDSLE